MRCHVHARAMSLISEIVDDGSFRICHSTFDKLIYQELGDNYWI